MFDRFSENRLPYNVNVETTGGLVLALLKQGSNLPVRAKQNFTIPVLKQANTQMTISYGNYALSVHNLLLFKHIVEPPQDKHIPPNFLLELTASRNLSLEISILPQWERRKTILYTVNLSTLLPPSPDRLDVYHDVFLSPAENQKETTFRVPSYTLCAHCEGIGVVKFVAQCSMCDGSGKRHGSLVDKVLGSDKCPYCDGKGHLTEKLCMDCKGGGYTNDFTTVKVKIPAEVKNGTKIRLRGMGKPGFGGIKGDLYLVAQLDSQ